MTAPGRPQTVVLHLGAHKTASTHVQQSLAAADLGPEVTFLGPKQLRGRGKSLPERFGFALKDGKPEGVAKPLSDVAQSARRLVLSDENFAGKLQTGWGRIPSPLYFTAPRRVASLAAAIASNGGPKLDLCLGIRDPAGYLTSSYSQILHGRRVVQPEKFIAKNPLAVVDWPNYLTRLRAASGVGTVTVWRYEDYTAAFPAICQALVDHDGITPLPERAQRRLSAEALRAVLLAKSLNAPNAVAEAAQQFPVTSENPPITLFDQETCAASAVLYADQWAAITAMPGVTALQPQ